MKTIDKYVKEVGGIIFKKSVRFDNEWVSNPMVLKSAKWYYIGRLCLSEDLLWYEPYSRESGYYITEKDAEDALNNNDYQRYD